MVVCCIGRFANSRGKRHCLSKVIKLKGSSQYVHFILEFSTPTLRGALYHHFRDKADLFAAVVRADKELVRVGELGWGARGARGPGAEAQRNARVIQPRRSVAAATVAGAGAYVPAVSSGASSLDSPPEEEEDAMEAIIFGT